MNARHVVVLGFRLFAVWVCIDALEGLALFNSFRSVNSFGHPMPYLVILAMFGSLVAVGLLVWFISGFLARVLTHGFRPQPVRRMSAYEWVAVGCVLMGLWWIQAAVQPLASTWLMAAVNGSQNGQSILQAMDVRSRIVFGMALVKLAFGIFFVVQTARIAGWTMRHVATAHDEQAIAEAAPPEA